MPPLLAPVLLVAALAWPGTGQAQHPPVTEQMGEAEPAPAPKATRSARKSTPAPAPAPAAAAPVADAPPPPPPPVAPPPPPVHHAPAPIAANPAPARLQIGDTTRALLQMQAAGSQAGRALPMLGEAASLSYQRYLSSFQHPIPEFFEATLPASEQGSP